MPPLLLVPKLNRWFITLVSRNCWGFKEVKRNHQILKLNLVSRFLFSDMYLTTYL